MAAPATNLIAPRDVAQILFRHKGKMALWSLAVVSGMLAFTVFGSREYRSEGKLFVRLGRENVTLDPTATMGQGPLTSVPQSREEEINSVVEILTSRVLMERTVDALGSEAILRGAAVDSPAEIHATIGAGALDGIASDVWSELKNRLNLGETVSPREKAVAKLERSVKVWAVSRSNVIGIRYEAATPQQAQTILSKLIDLYLEQHVHLNRTPGARDFFAEQTEQLRERLTAVENERRDLKNSTGVAAADEQRRVMIERLGRLQDDILKTGAEQTVAAARISSLRQRLKLLPRLTETERVQGLLQPGADAMRQHLYALQVREKELLSKYTDEHLLVKEIRQQVDEAQKILADEDPERVQITLGRNREYDEAESALLIDQTTLAASEARAAVLVEQLAQTQVALRSLNESELQLARLDRELRIQEDNYHKYAENLEQGRIDAALELQRISNINLFQPATLQEQPIRPKKMLNLGLSLVAAILGSFGLAFLAEYFDHSLQTAADVEQHLSLPALVAIPHLRTRDVTLTRTLRGQHDQRTL